MPYAAAAAARILAAAAHAPLPATFAGRPAGCLLMQSAHTAPLRRPANNPAPVPTPLHSRQRTRMVVVARHSPAMAEAASSRHRQFANFLSVASSVLGGAILQVFLSPPTAVTADAADDPDGFGWCEPLRACAAWQRAWQLSCVLAFCFVFLSIIACATASIAKQTRTGATALAAAILFFFASFVATAVTVLAIVFLTASKATCIATSAMLISLLVCAPWLGWEGLAMGLDDVVLAPRLWDAAAAGDLPAVRRYLRLGASATWGKTISESEATDGKRYFLSSSGAASGELCLAKRAACSAAAPCRCVLAAPMCLHPLRPPFAAWPRRCDCAAHRGMQWPLRRRC